MHFNDLLCRDDVTIVTGTERVARELRARRALLKTQKGLELWADPVFIGPLRRLLTAEWETLFDSRQLLHSEQVLTLCKQCIDRSGVAEDVISTMSLARTMRQAERLLCEYRLPVDRQEHYFGVELKSFLGWHEQFRERLKRDGYVTEYELVDEMVLAVREGRWRPPQTLVTVGFIQFTPQQLALLEALQEQGTEVIHLQSEDHSKAIYKCVSHSEEEEVKAAADWFRHQLDVVPNGHQPPRMALIVPGLSNRRNLVAQILESELSPNGLLAGVQSEAVELSRGFAFAGGEKLGELPWVRCAMDLIGVRLRNNSLENLSRLLMGFASPLDQSIRFEMGKIDLQLRKRHGWQLPGKAFVALLTRSTHMKVRQLGAVIDAYLERPADSLLPSEWADSFEQVIGDAGFLDEAWMNRGELHQWWAFQEALDVFRSLDAQLGTISFEPAYRWLDEVCHTRWFSGEHDASAPLQVLSPSEAVGLAFDRVWIMGLDSKNLPEIVEPNPFLPVHVQVRAGVPTANPELNAAHAELLTAELMKLSVALIVSYSENNGGAPTLPSGLIPWKDIAALDSASFARDGRRKPVKLTSAKGGDRFPEVSGEEKAELKSGLSIFADFARDNLAGALIHRLHIKPFPQVEAGISSSLQGQLVHAALARFWIQTRTSARLHQYSEDELDSLALNCVQAAMENDKACSELRYGRKLLILERIRIKDLVLSWLTFEKSRPEAFEVVVCEGETAFTIEGMEFPVRIDRIDRVFCEDGKERFLIIDYKTGRIVDMRELNADRMTAPQLPIYSTFTDLSAFNVSSPDGVALAKVFANELVWHVRSCWTVDINESSIGGSVSKTSDQTWQNQLEAWRNRLISDARGFLSGESVMSYRPHEYLGNHDHLAPLMRLGDVQNAVTD